MINRTFYSIFQQGSRTYFYSSLFFPTRVRRDVFILYGFVRKADNFVDSIPQQKDKFYQFVRNYHSARNGHQTNDIVIDAFVDLARRKHFNFDWVDAFLASMESDLHNKPYHTIEDTVEYMYGSAEVIGLMMSRVMDLPDKALYYARYLGRAMQYINFIRDIAEDLDYDRRYFPDAELDKYQLTSLQYEYTKEHPGAFTAFIQAQINRYCQWQMIAEKGYSYIPKRYLISVKTASEMYHWTAEQIYKHPFVVYEWKVKPLITQILTTTLANIIDPHKTKYSPLYCSQSAVPHLSQV